MDPNQLASADYRLPTETNPLRKWTPFGIGLDKPKHFRDMAGIIWKNRDNLSYGWKILSKGVCDGCALGVAGFHDWTIDGVHLCMTRLNLLRLNTMPAMQADALEDSKTLASKRNSELRELGRLAYPMLREKGAPGFRRISWDDAIDRVATRIRTSQPDRLAFFVTSRGVTNEVYYVAQKAARWLGTNNVDNAARICHSPSTAAMKRTLGVAATTCTYPDWYKTDLIVFFGSNPANDQPVTTKYLHEAKKKGAQVVMVNPYLEPGMQRYWVPSTAESALFGTEIADYWFPVSQGGDIAFLAGTMKILIEQGWCNTPFLADHVEGLDELRAALDRLQFSDLERDAGLPASAMRRFAELLRDAPNAVLVWSMGITQHTFGADAVQMILNLGLLRGHLGRTGNGLMPIRGHSSVQGGSEMGAYATAFPGGLPITPENAARLSAQYGFPVPDQPGLTATQMVEAANRNELDLLYCLGGNFLRTLPEPDYVAAAMRKVPLRVHQDIIATDQMFLPADGDVLLLPAKTRYEQEDGGVETSTERRVMFTPEIPRKVGEAKTEWKILRQIALAARPENTADTNNPAGTNNPARTAFGCETGQAVREEIARVVPFYQGIEKLSRTGDSFVYGGPHLCPDGHCPTESGKARIHAVRIPDRAMKPTEFHVSTRRGKQFNSLIYAQIDPLNGAARDSILINEEDAAELHLMAGDPIELVSDVGTFHGHAFPAPIARRNLQIHWPEGNELIQKGRVDAGGGVPDYNARVTIRKPGHA